ncbi:hypothetical protein PtA15_14A235 [Puccinia triticina]|uniref:Uncharacterized protein n=1 Tax=Puccinia triticina TaxID=208348 RepID=A0ABY7D502_9BASI|nr:uncharacterized protein PtA15_14A235 [Puccinia triticina]WAQ91352.1 hypothetical protein PtA15_14A235 [Puccinia triticina]
MTAALMLTDVQVLNSRFKVQLFPEMKLPRKHGWSVGLARQQVFVVFKIHNSKASRTHHAPLCGLEWTIIAVMSNSKSASDVAEERRPTRDKPDPWPAPSNGKKTALTLPKWITKLSDS